MFQENDKIFFNATGFSMQYSKVTNRRLLVMQNKCMGKGG